MRSSGSSEVVAWLLSLNVVVVVEKKKAVDVHQRQIVCHHSICSLWK